MQKDAAEGRHQKSRFKIDELLSTAKEHASDAEFLKKRLEQGETIKNSSG